MAIQPAGPATICDIVDFRRLRLPKRYRTLTTGL
jgi:hypothetical protein